MRSYLKGERNMERDELEQLKLKADEEREKTIFKLLENDKEYKKAMEQFAEAEKQFFDLDLSEYEKKVILNYMQLWDCVKTEYSTYSYLAGIYNARSSVCLRF